jgi:hypothetical protein
MSIILYYILLSLCSNKCNGVSYRHKNKIKMLTFNRPQLPHFLFFTEKKWSYLKMLDL